MCFSPIDFQWTSIIRRYWQTATKSCKSKTEWMLCIIIICSKSINDNDKMAHLSQRWCLGRTFCWWWVRTCRDSQTSRGEDAANRKAVDKMNMLKKKKSITSHTDVIMHHLFRNQSEAAVPSSREKSAPIFQGRNKWHICCFPVKKKNEEIEGI